MTNLFLYILVSSVMCSVCGLSVMLLNRFVKGVSQRLKCNILMLAVILPYAGVFASPLFPAAQTVSVHTVTAVVSEHTGQTEADLPPDKTPDATTAAKKQVPEVSPDIVGAAAWIWLVVAAGMLIYGIIRHIRLSRMLRGERTLMRGSGRLRVYTVGMRISPFLTGFFRPAIYIPADTYGNGELELVIAHETAHYRRGDLYRRLLITVLNCVNWFNPLYRYVLKELIRQTEYACDEMVTNELGEGSDKSYGYMLLKTAGNGGRNEYLSVGLGSDAGDLKRRIEMFMNKDKKLSRNARALTFGAFALAAVLCIGGCGAAMATIEPAEAHPDEEIVWYSKYYDDMSQVPQEVKVGRYYKINGTPEEYIEVYPDETIQLSGYDYAATIAAINPPENVASWTDETWDELRRQGEFFASRNKFIYNPINAFIGFAEPEYSILGFILASEDTIVLSEETGNVYVLDGNTVNADGQTLGAIPEGAEAKGFPDLIPVIGDNGKEGYIYADEIFGATPPSPEEALKIHEATENGIYEPKTVNVYETDGKTIIDTFTEGPNETVQITLPEE